jgi:hypothetical protein
VAVDSARPPAWAPGRWARVAPLPRELGRAAGVGDGGEGAQATDARDRGEMGDPMLAAGCGRERPDGDGLPTGGPGRRGSNRI